MKTIEEAYRDYIQTKIIRNNDGAETHISPRGHYSGETFENFKHKVNTDDEFKKRWCKYC